jgi:hypothetical protein
MKASDGGGWDSEGGAQGGTAEEEEEEAEERQCRGRRRARRGGRRRREAATGGARTAARSAAAVAATAVAAGLIVGFGGDFRECGSWRGRRDREDMWLRGFGPVTKAYAGPGREGPASSKPKYPTGRLVDASPASQLSFLLSLS